MLSLKQANAAIDLTDQRFGRLTVIGEAGRNSGHRLWQCRCECGNLHTVSASDLRRGHTKSCGCRKGWPKGKPDTRLHRGEVNGNTHLSTDDIREIFRLRKAGWLQREIGEEFGIVQCSVSAILRGQNWGHVADTINPNH